MGRLSAGLRQDDPQHQANAWDHFGTTRYARDWTTCTSAHPVLACRSIADLHRCLNPCPGGQGVAGSNPAVPTGRQVFSNILMPPPEPTKEPFHREMALPEAHATMCPGLLPGHSSTRQSPRNRQSRGQRSPSHPGHCTATPAAANPRTPSPAHWLTVSQTRTGPQKLWDAGRPERTRQACPRHLRRDAYSHEISFRTNRHDSCQRHGKRLAVMKCAYRRIGADCRLPRYRLSVRTYFLFRRESCHRR
jgi:hypothetical protein